MKAGMTSKVKFKKLQKRLGCSVATTIGTLELLWQATVMNAPSGDIGILDNESIAIECGWDGDPDELISHLVDTGWLDECDEHRLIVHDWSEHCPNYIKGNLSNSGKTFSKPVVSGETKSCTRDGTKSDTKSDTKSGTRSNTKSGTRSDTKSGTRSPTTKSSQAMSIQVKPVNQANPVLTKPDGVPYGTCRAASRHDRVATADIDAVVTHYRTHHTQARPGDKERKAIAARLKDGWTVGELCEAIDGMHVTPFNLGDNDRNQPYLALAIAMRNSDQVTRFLQNNREPPKRHNAVTRAAQAAIEDFCSD